MMCNEDQSQWPTVDRFIDHMVYAAELVGVDHIGIGTDRWKRPTLDYRCLLYTSAVRTGSFADAIQKGNGVAGNQTDHGEHNKGGLLYTSRCV